jgi:hypothetical protein
VMRILVMRKVMGDERDYALIGSDLLRDGSPPEGWPLELAFPAGDVGCGSGKVTASALG